MESVADATSTAVDAIELSNELQPIRIMGYACDFNICVTIITTVVSFFAFVFSIIYDSSANT